MQKKVITSLWIFGFVLCLAQIWLPTYYVTGDGPCHLYNAQILHDNWVNKSTSFYKNYFDIIYQPDPNWYSTAIFAMLLFVVKGVYAEKIVLTIYMLMYLAGFHRLLKKVNPDTGWWPLVIFFFLFPHTLAKGFYNFSFSIAFYFWMVLAWIGFLEKQSIWKGIRFFLFTLLVYFSHLMSFEFGAFTCFGLLISWAYSSYKEENGLSALSFFFKQLGYLALVLMPFLLLMFSFSDKQGGLQLQLHHHFYRLVELLQFKFALSVHSYEVPFAYATGIIILLLIVVCLIRFKDKLVVGPYDGLIIVLVGLVVVYLFFPESFLGRLILITMRVQPYLYILFVCLIAMMCKYRKLLNIGAIIIYLSFIAMGISRINIQLRASDGVKDILSSSSYIKPNSVVLPLNFSLNGKDEHGNIIADINWLFCHASDYLGMQKPLIMLDNYEANIGYFPVRWKNEQNPYWHLATYDGIEGLPPSADIDAYKKKTGVDIDYILLWCWEPKSVQDTHFYALYQQINKSYHLLYTSATNRTMLYQRN